MGSISRQLTQIFAVFLLLSFAGLGSALAQDKGGMASAKKGEPVTKVLVDNDKVRVYESTFKPGDVSPNRARVARVVRYLNSGTLQRVYPDGKTEDRKFKAGDVVWIEPATYAVKNVGKTNVTVYGVETKAK
jgi:quercetin dioxygenase-like cupin family protein